MSHDNSMQISQPELRAAHGRYVEPKSNKGLMGLIIKALVIPLLALLVILIGTALSIANFTPTTYTQVKDYIFEKVDVATITGLPDTTNKEILDSWLVLNPEQLPSGEKAQELSAQKESVPDEQTERPVN